MTDHRPSSLFISTLLLGSFRSPKLATETSWQLKQVGIDLIVNSLLVSYHNIESRSQWHIVFSRKIQLGCQNMFAFFCD